MPIWKITSKGPIKVQETKLKHEKLLEENLEDWIIADPSILGEPLLIIGRQVIIPDVKDRLDILALDPQGNAVIIELKRGKLKDPVDIQALRYASYISKWRFEDFENQARLYLRKEGEEFNFNELYEQFCADAGIDEVPDINSDQRLIIVGSEVKDKLGSVALWLREHNIDIKVIEVEVYREGDTIFVQPRTIIPLPVSKFAYTGRGSRGEGQPWITDGKTWHLEKRCSPKTKEILLKLDDLIRDNFEVDGPRWNQKFYVAYRVGNYNWLAIKTFSSALRLEILVKANIFNQSELARRLNIQEFDKDESFAEKLGLPSSVMIQNRNEFTDRIILRIKEGFDLENKAFIDFLKEAYKAFPKL
ncbi:hypothetical protein NLC26_00295 [Candidatus Aminicenantes bacterium AC-708-M15]|jgi:hypothetical protein|nr:hypothetical protein [SCandidatus Aminicenantes bacterium Aminicenantia_JdfR_composite]MCP2596504.1 hypothetical protein [Candidatus Aminicenantes bacterium AC-335-G13]MCP2603901.1 hypothetical protein [Candidatus Aminicenantes bacterium AC-708-M15]MCP2618098.1 hypothetical protein [Candidatus Aminicenantes bacterium AC-335-A11]